MQDLSPASSSRSTVSHPNESPEIGPLTPRASSSSDQTLAFVKGPKRKRLAKACDACHKSKRRCDGTSPCGNCYYASKTCTYTDSSGRAVPAPRLRSPSKTQQQRRDTSSDPPVQDSEDIPDSAQRKRIRTSPQVDSHLSIDHLSLTPAPVTSFGHALVYDRFTEQDHTLTLELVNPLSQNYIPQYLMYAVFALAAPLSKQPRIRTSPSRLAGRDFAQESISLMFDGAGRLICPANLMTAQALCLLRVHDFRLRAVNSRNHEMAYRIIQSLGLAQEPDPGTEETVQMAIDRECSRRIIWNIYCTNLSDMIYIRAPVSPKDIDVSLRLPMDETSFEFFSSTTLPAPEYLELSTPIIRHRSEFGHFIRISRIANRIEHMLNPLTGREPEPNPAATLIECEQDLALWEASLPDHLRYDEETFHVQSSMFETNANTAAWCYFCMHVYHASCALALNCAKQHHQKGPKSEPRWALARFEKITDALASKGKNTYLLTSVIWALRRYCSRNDAQIQNWVDEVDDFWGLNVLEQADNVALCPPQLALTTNMSFVVHQTQLPIVDSSQLYALGRSHIPQSSRLFPQQPPAQVVEVDPQRVISSSVPNGFREVGNIVRRSSLGSAIIEPTPQTTAAVNGSRNPISTVGSAIPVMNGEIEGTPRSLPSLKSSGLLDSWSHPQLPAHTNTHIHANAHVHSAHPMASSAPVAVHLHHLHHTAATLTHSPVPSTLSLGHPETDSSRTGAHPSQTGHGHSSNMSTYGMPVGMPWLANEAR